MGMPGGSNFIFPRLYRHAFVLAVDSFEDSTLSIIFSTIMDWHFSKGYPDKVVNMGRVSNMCLLNSIILSDLSTLTIVEFRE